jgi:hypothetical protein
MAKVIFREICRVINENFEKETKNKDQKQSGPNKKQY